MSPSHLLPFHFLFLLPFHNYYSSDERARFLTSHLEHCRSTSYYLHLRQWYLKFCFNFVEALEVAEESSDSEFGKVGDAGLDYIYFAFWIW